MTILSIESRQRKKQWRVILEFSTGESLEIDPEAFALFDLHAGDTIDESTKDKVLNEDLQRRALQQALRWLAVRPQASGELQRRLNQKGFSAVAEDVIDKLRTQQYLNDEDFARRYVKTRLLTKTIGSRLIEQELKGKGISGEIVQRVVDEFMDDETTFRLAKKAASKKLTGLKKLESSKEKQKLYRFLLQRGFHAETITKVIDDLKNTDG